MNCSTERQAGEDAIVRYASGQGRCSFNCGRTSAAGCRLNAQRKRRVRTEDQSPDPGARKRVLGARRDRHGIDLAVTYGLASEDSHSAGTDRTTVELSPTLRQAAAT